jgi:signal transduction histidine kinase
MPLRQWFQPPRHLLVWFAVVAVAPALVIAWLSWRIAQQDRALESHRLQERLESAANLAAAALDRLLSEIEQQLVDSPDSPRPENLAHGAVFAVFDARGLVRHSGDGLLYYPALPRPPEPSESLFSPGEILEFQRGDYRGATRAFRELSRTSDPLVRAGALVRLARNHRKAGNHVQALAAYDELIALGSTPAGGLPAELVGRQGRAALFEEARRQQDLQREAAVLDAALHSGRWPLTRASYRFLTGESSRWVGRQVAQPEVQDRLSLSAGAESVWGDWQDSALEQENRRGQRTLWVHDRSVLLLWRASQQKLALAVVGPQYLESQWLGRLSALRTTQAVEFALTDAAGHRVLGPLNGTAQRQAVRTASHTRLPWTVHALATAAMGSSELSGRRRLLLAGLAMTALLVLAGSYLIARAVSRELAVARLQSDFVSAVSHQFRTPLTTLLQLSEMLLRGRVSAEERRRQFYQALVRQSRHLHRLVESLLNFGRMQAGTVQYRFEPIDLGDLVRSTVAEFREEVPDCQVEFRQNGDRAPIRADRESLARVFWNLLDNAVKYSPESRTAWLELEREGPHLAVRVRDRGLGIPVEEQPQIFGKFVRGAAAKASNITGTGLGLAMAREIVVAHGGRIALESAPGQGSTFTVLLPPAE